MFKPLAIDLCCGLGGWTEGLLREGWRVIGFDIARPRSFPKGALFVQQDIRTINAERWRAVGVSLIVASPPCSEFSQMWRIAKHRSPNPAAGVELVEHCWRIAAESEAPIILENVRGAERYIGKAVAHVGPYFLWGDVPAFLPCGTFYKGIWNTDRARDGSRRWEHHGRWRARTYQRDKALRSKIPLEIAIAVASQLKPS